jgi:hypothetical protein
MGSLTLLFDARMSRLVPRRSGIPTVEPAMRLALSVLAALSLLVLPTAIAARFRFFFPLFMRRT